MTSHPGADDGPNAELLRVADAMLAEIRAAREACAQLLEVLDQAATATRAPEAAGQRASGEGGSHPAGDADAIRPIVLEMARTGHSRGEVEAFVGESFGLRLPRGLLDDVFGPKPARDGQAAQ